MSELDPIIAELEARLERLVFTQVNFQKEISAIRGELIRLKYDASLSTPRINPEIKVPQPPVVTDTPPTAVPVRPAQSDSSDDLREVPQGVEWTPSFGMKDPSAKQRRTSDVAPLPSFSSYADPARANLEKFIGENLISKIGIVVLVLGVGIGAKYAIDNGWVSPLMRIVFGYLVGFGLLGFAAKLKSRYHDFSAVLVSGGMAILYFVTYFAYAYYSLIPQAAAFPLMAMFTAFTVASAILYDRQVIAHIGLVGAYAVPYLLSDNSGNYLFLFCYMTIVNAGVLAISVKRYWTPLFYTSSAFTWLIFGGWFATRYVFAEHFYLALTFLAVFFVCFYAAKVIHGVVHSENEDAESIVAILLTGFVFYAFVFAISDVRAETFHYAVIFTYLAGASLAILLTSYKYYGRIFTYLSYPFTWLIFGVWFFSYYQAGQHFVVAAVFASMFFAIYYAASLFFRVATNEIGMAENAGLVLSNSFIYYGLGFAIVDSRESLRGFEGLFTVGHAAFHFFVAQVISRLRSSAIDVVQVLAVLVVTFSTLAIPVQFDGNLVTLIWTVEAAALFWFGRARSLPFFEYFSFPIMVLGGGSLILDWTVSGGLQRVNTADAAILRPFANGDFIAAAVFVIAFAFIYAVNREEEYKPAVDPEAVRPFGIAVATASVAVLYNMLRLEIGNYFQTQMAFAKNNALGPDLNLELRDLRLMNTVWQINYSMLFMAFMGVVNIRKARSVIVARANAALGLICIVIFATLGMQMFYELRESYILAQPASDPMNIVIRWISYIFAAGLLMILFKYRDVPLMADTGTVKQRLLGFDGVLFVTVFIAASCELLNLTHQFQIEDGSKLGLSILWGFYALFLIALGIKQGKKHLRIAAMVLFAVTLFKLFLYDIADLPTISKTILFVTLGILLLIISFLYNKYRYFIFKDGADQNI
jgi:uncharacterized membrane protein